MSNIKCNLITCIKNQNNMCTKEDLEFTYFDDYIIFKDLIMPDGTKFIDYFSNNSGHFMGLYCRDFKMDETKVLSKYKDWRKYL